MGPSPYRGPVDTCVACGAELGVGRFCLNCGHRIGAPAPARPVPDPAPAPAPAARTATSPPRDRPTPPDDEPGQGPAPVVPPVQAADPTPVPPTTPPDVPPEVPRDDAARPPARRATWDPREDLLPYEEVDDVDGDLPVRGLAWIGWVAGAALLVGLAFVLLQVYDTDGDQVASDTSGDASTGTQAPAPEAEPTDEGGADDGAGAGADDGADNAPAGVGKARDLTRGATFEVPGTAPPTTDFDGNLVAYEASQMGDRNPATAWRTAGDATSQAVTVTLNQPGVVNRVGLVNGYAKQVAGVDWYPNNRRILAVTWGFDDGSTIQQTFAERPDMQWLKVPPVETETVTVTIDAVTPPGSGNLGRDYTAISEVGVTGRRAG